LNGLENDVEFVDDKLIFTNLSRNKFDGVYECLVTLSQGQSVQSGSKVNIIVSCKLENFKIFNTHFYKLNFIKVPVDLKVKPVGVIRYNESDTTNISCIAEGYPKQDLFWSYISNNTNDVVNDVVYLNNSLTSNILVMEIRNISKYQQGVYECYTNDLENSERIGIIVQSW
jgi:hypothetical protein